MRADKSQPIVEQYLGLSFEEAAQKAKKEEFSYRISFNNGNPQILTRDHNLSRINFVLKNGVVVDADLG